MKLTGRGLAAVFLLVMVAGICVRLGFWQLDRLDQRRTRNAGIREAISLPVVRLVDDSLRRFEADPFAYQNRRVRIRGVYDGSHEFVLRGRSRNGRPGVHVVTPLRIAGSDAVVLVNRGWVPAPDATTVSLPSVAEPGVRDVTGLVSRIPADLEPLPYSVERGTSTVLTVQRLNLGWLHQRLPYPVLPVVLQQLPESARASPPFRIPPPSLDEGPHLSYAVQWFSFAAIAVIGLLVVAVRKRR